MQLGFAQAHHKTIRRRSGRGLKLGGTPCLYTGISSGPDARNEYGRTSNMQAYYEAASNGKFIPKSKSGLVNAGTYQTSKA